MLRKIIFFITIILTVSATMLPLSMQKNFQPAQEVGYISYLSGWLKYDTHRSEMHCVYEQEGYPGLGAEIIEIYSFSWEDPNTRLIIYLRRVDGSEITNEMWAGGRVDYRFFNTSPDYTYYIEFYYDSYYGDESDEPYVIYDGLCNIFGPDSDVP